MVSVNGQADTKTGWPSIIYSNTDWDDCVQKCYNDQFCDVAYGNSSLICVFYGISDFGFARKEIPSAALHRASFKLDIPNGLCTTKLDDLFKGSQSYGRNGISIFQITITSDKYDANYYYEEPCDKPFVYSCGCSESMYLFRGTGPPTDLGTTRDIPTWFLCVLQCSTDVDCVLAWFSGYRKCTMYSFGSFNSMSRSEDPAIQPDTPNYITLKIFPLKSNCPMTEHEVLNLKNMVIPAETTTTGYANFSMTWTASSENIEFSWVPTEVRTY
ncbi:hypothetical protein CRE_17937 [Caenorhabditis remanei]|uniref:PAN-3 domain-containing protein n=1 Tax=Caenorhabditis remanei TaxID=31234 RepID=E3MDN1_CAERE|nr:hypothetical protein CRE_17937 [Caenorhabditis remanei]